MQSHIVSIDFETVFRGDESLSYLSKIEWTDATWNPVIGCTKISPGCKNCYAERLAERFRGVPAHVFEYGFDLRLNPRSLELPLKWKTPKKIFVSSMSDIFHEDIPSKYIYKVFNIMFEANWHTFQILTKRSDRLLKMQKDLPWASNIWVGVSVENQDYIYRILHLLRIPAEIRFLSLEPLLGPTPNLPLDGIDWVIAGGESGPHARPMSIDWIREIQEQCASQKVAFFLKQLGGKQNKRGGDEATLDGKQWHEFPEIAYSPANT